jgi:hypothetical protein
MITEKFMRSKAIVVIMVGVIFCLQGCSTFKGATKGAAEGAKEDWKVLQKTDDWIKEHLW